MIGINIINLILIKDGGCCCCDDADDDVAGEVMIILYYYDVERSCFLVFRDFFNIEISTADEDLKEEKDEGGFCQ
jgi:hypothetical protein